MKPEGLKQSPTKPVNVPKLDKVATGESPSPGTSEPNIFSLLWLRFVEKVKHEISLYQKGESPMETNVDFKKITVSIIVRLLLKVGGGALLTIGLTTGELTEIVGAVVAIVGGFVASWFNSKKLIDTEPPKK
jgi:uncharacterized membrane protein YphA (DoxX/SURF4 family)